jgi:hypothetical protein
LAKVTIAEIDFRSILTGPDGGNIFTASTVRFNGNMDLTTAGDVPGGNKDK